MSLTAGGDVSPEGQPPFGSGSPRRRWLGAALGLGVIALVMASRVLTGDGVADDRQVVFRVERDGSRVDQDSELNERLAGDLVLEDRTVRAAYCVNGWYWADDVTLNTVVRVATSPQLVRAAQLVAAAEVDADMAWAVETWLLTSPHETGEDFAALSSDVRDRWDRADLEAYLSARSVPPSSEAARRFVVFAASRSVWSQFIFFVDLDNANRAAIERFSEMPDLGPDEIGVAGSATALTMNSRDCDALNLP